MVETDGAQTKNTSNFESPGSVGSPLAAVGQSATSFETRI